MGFTAGILWQGGATPFQDDEKAKVNSFLLQVMDLEPNWVFTLNFYPYFDQTIGMDDDNIHCSDAMQKCKCFDKNTCLNMVSMIQARKQITLLTKNSKARFWVGEVGWSAPGASTLNTKMKNCAEFSGYKMLYDYYKNFLTWDLSIPDGYVAPEMAFYFSIRDSENFGNKEHFGLIGKCDDETCKLNRKNAGVAPRTQLRLPSAHAELVS